jgi:hypothetical protein
MGLLATDYRSSVGVCMPLHGIQDSYMPHAHTGVVTGLCRRLQCSGQTEKSCLKAYAIVLWLPPPPRSAKPSFRDQALLSSSVLCLGRIIPGSAIGNSTGGSVLFMAWFGFSHTKDMRALTVPK